MIKKGGNSRRHFGELPQILMQTMLFPRIDLILEGRIRSYLERGLKYEQIIEEIKEKTGREIIKKIFDVKGGKRREKKMQRRRREDRPKRKEETLIDWNPLH